MLEAAQLRILTRVFRIHYGTHLNAKTIYKY